MRPNLCGLAACAGLILSACSVFKPALGNTNCRETVAVEVSGDLTAEGKKMIEKEREDWLIAPTSEDTTNLGPDFAPPVAAILTAGLGFVSSEVQAAVDYDKDRYTAQYSGSAVLDDFWTDSKLPAYKSIILKRMVPGDETASTFVLSLDRTGGATSSKFLVKPTGVTIDQSMAKLLKGGVFSIGSWFGDTTTLLSVEVKLKVEDIGVKEPTSSEVTVTIPGYDMEERGDYYANPETAKTWRKPATAGVVDFPMPSGLGSSNRGLYRVTVTVSEKDPLNADRSVEAEKTLVKDIFEALKPKAKDDSGAGNSGAGASGKTPAPAPAPAPTPGSNPQP